MNKSKLEPEDFLALIETLYGKFAGYDLLADLEAEHWQELRQEKTAPPRCKDQINAIARSNNDTP